MRPATVAAALGLALAVGTPTAWELTRPPAAAGVPVDEALASPTTSPPAPVPVPPTTPAPTPDRFPLLGTDDGSPPVVIEPPAPVRLVVPDLGIDAPVDAVGVAEDGQMEIPEDIRRVGWYRFGPSPGQDGSAVVAGHVDSREQGLGELFALREAEVGDEIRVTHADGTTTPWRVVSRELIQKRVLPLDRLFSREGPPRLTLITCGGPFLPEHRSYRDNVVVVAEPLG